VGAAGRFQRWWVWVRNGLAVLGGIQVAILFTPLTKWWLEALTGPWESPAGNVMVVLGGDQVGTGAAGPSTHWRCFHAAHLWKRGGFQRLVLSGAGEPPLADEMKRMLVIAGVPEEFIATEMRSTTTRENALETANLGWNREDRLVLVSSDFHMRRATAAFRRAGLEVTPCPAPDGIKQYLRVATRWSLALELGIETVKYGYYRLRQWA
jgi:uncharacterized SAM-binding protein YcdF (DUF218 family)